MSLERTRCLAIAKTQFAQEALSLGVQAKRTAMVVAPWPATLCRSSLTLASA